MPVNCKYIYVKQGGMVPWCTQQLKSAVVGPKDVGRIDSSHGPWWWAANTQYSERVVSTTIVKMQLNHCTFTPYAMI